MRSPTKGLLAPPKTFQKSDDKNSRSRSSSFSRLFSSGSSDNSPRRQVPPLQEISTSAIPPELVPIVTLLSAQSHRRYHEGVFLILKDLNSDGSPAARTWKEVYGVLIGNQLALWDARLLAENGQRPEDLMEATSKPTYVNFTDASFRPLDHKEAVIAEGKKQLQNTIVVSTTLKNRYFLQFSDKEAFTQWHAALRLSAFEFTALQEAYTGAFLSTKGAKLGDIRVILADTKFDYEDWVSVRFGAGMPWKRCYAVVSQPSKKSKSKRICGEINFYENEKKTKKVKAMTTVEDACAVYALYPSSPVLIDTSTMIKLEGKVSFGKKDAPTLTDIFIMPEKHYAVPGYDTIIRFLIPIMNAFQLYGRPKRLIADRNNLDSLLFGLPTLPHVHFLQLQDIMPLASSASNMEWSILDWRNHIKALLLKKIDQGYTGCGSSEGLTGALASPAIGSNDLFDSSPLPTSPLLASVSRLPSENKTEFGSIKSNLRNAATTDNIDGNTSKSGLHDSSSKASDDKGFVTETAPSATQVPRNGGSFEDVSDDKKQSRKKLTPTIDIQDSNFSEFEREALKPKTSEALGFRKSELSTIYDKYSQMPFGDSAGQPPSLPIDRDNRDSFGAYNDYIGSPKVKNLDISNLRDSNSTDQTDLSRVHDFSGEGGRRSFADSFQSGEPAPAEERSVKDDVLEDFYSLSQQISKMGLDSQDRASFSASKANVNDDFNFEASETNDSIGALDNVFDPDYLEQNQMLDNESNYTANESKSQYSGDNTNLSYQPLQRDQAQPSYGGEGFTYSQKLPKQRAANHVVTPTSPQFYPNHPVENQNAGSAERLGKMKHSPAYPNLNTVNTQTNGSPSHRRNPVPPPPQGAQYSPNNMQHRRPGPQGVPSGAPRPVPQQYPQQVPQQAFQQVPRAMSKPIPQQVPYSNRPYVPAGAPNAYGRPNPPAQYPPTGAVPLGQPGNSRGPGYAMGPHPQARPMRPTASQPMNQAAPQVFSQSIPHPNSKLQAKSAQPSPRAGGFSQFMPATANNPNPYSANPYTS